MLCLHAAFSVLEHKYMLWKLGRLLAYLDLEAFHVRACGTHVGHEDANSTIISRLHRSLLCLKFTQYGGGILPTRT